MHSTEQQLTSALYDSITEFQGIAQLASFQHAQMRQYLAEHLAGALDAAGWVPGDDAMVAEIRRLRADAAAELLPAWEAVYEPGNVSDYLIGYTNDECAAKAAAEAWLRSQAEVTGRLEWVPDEQLATGRYDRWFELVEHHDDGIPTGPGLIVRRRTAVEAHVVADDSDDPEHTDDCPGCDLAP